MKSFVTFVLRATFLGCTVAVLYFSTLVFPFAQDRVDTSLGAEPTSDERDPSMSADKVVLRAGTEVKLTFAQDLSSKHATMGEKVDLRVVEDIKVDGLLVVPSGARVLGTVVQGKKDEKRGNSKDLAVKIDYIVVKGKRIQLTGEQRQKAKTNVGSATAATIGFGLTGLTIYMNNREAWIHEGYPATGYIEEDVIFDISQLGPAEK